MTKVSVLFWFGKSSAPQQALEVKASSVSQLVSPTDDFLSLFGITPTASGASVSPLSAMTVPAVRAAVLAISEALGQIEAHVYEIGDNAQREAKDHPAYALVHDAANPWTSANDLREQLTRDALLYGNGYASISRDSDGNPVELHHLRAGTVAVYIDLNTLEPSYQHTPLNGSMITYAYSDVIHLRGASSLGIVGDSPVMEAREAIGMAIVLEGFANRLFANGARPSGALTASGILTAPAIERLKASIQAAFGGGNSGGTMVLESGMTFNQTSLTSVDAQFLEMRDFQIKEIARVFRVNPILLGEMVHASFANSAEMGRQFIQYTLTPWTIRWQNEISLKLLSQDDRTSFRIELDTDGFDRADIAARATAYSSLIASRVFNPNECRELESKAPYAGGDKFENPNVITETIREG